jgi:hypothetical protein
MSEGSDISERHRVMKQYSKVNPIQGRMITFENTDSRDVGKLLETGPSRHYESSATREHINDDLYREESKEGKLGEEEQKKVLEDDSLSEEEVNKRPKSSYTFGAKSYQSSEGPHSGVGESKKSKTITKKVKTVTEFLKSGSGERVYNKAEFEAYLNRMEESKDKLSEIELEGSGYTEEAIQGLTKILKECSKLKVCFIL